jgi:hypothetical protein
MVNFFLQQLICTPKSLYLEGVGAASCKNGREIGWLNGFYERFIVVSAFLRYIT